VNREPADPAIARGRESRAAVGGESRYELIDGVLEVVPHRLEVDHERPAHVDLPVKVRLPVCDCDPQKWRLVLPETNPPVLPGELCVGFGVATAREVPRKKLDPALTLAGHRLVQLRRAMDANGEQYVGPRALACRRPPPTTLGHRVPGIPGGETPGRTYDGDTLRRHCRRGCWVGVLCDTRVSGVHDVICGARSRIGTGREALSGRRQARRTAGGRSFLPSNVRRRCKPCCRRFGQGECCLHGPAWPFCSRRWCHKEDADPKSTAAMSSQRVAVVSRARRFSAWDSGHAMSSCRRGKATTWSARGRRRPPQAAARSRAVRTIRFSYTMLIFEPVRCPELFVPQVPDHAALAPSESS
jgi:hypothetical protein